ncbi:Phycocyanin (plasmid) [Thalassoporum mexicanum PCC 7367]|uniref:phycocyanin n=1 Tax=Thalassoporum mexicanum TaxID=3457544 RepID=UPI00029FFBC9|nr:phycocyanin [Pseudanabaena sp. PCC 7367]AFY72099.1 Phycocyanin [Pseudanabaena sp. PCC 7367]
MTPFQLNAKVRELIEKARIVSFETWQDTHPPEAIALFQAADDDRRYLTDPELNQIQALAPAQSEMVSIAAQLRDEAKGIVDEARAEVLRTFPDITAPGGGLYPPERAEACWRDFWHFLRCVTYGIAGGRTDYLSAVGLDYLQQLYHELSVPLEAMVEGLGCLKNASLQRLTPAHADSLSPYFDRLIAELKQFK